ncbi:uncharacterized protein LOC122240542 [Panthera tigris]|uniref:uncharacterized protein LOC122240542 n=1 Tax=Panthera tigris TaxID=9694 RepID=UPI001C6F71C2|nr:uncharacterized protein LOC122240542 [Panthera tigris]
MRSPPRRVGGNPAANLGLLWVEVGVGATPRPRPTRFALEHWEKPATGRGHARGTLGTAQISAKPDPTAPPPTGCGASGPLCTESEKAGPSRREPSPAERSRDQAEVPRRPLPDTAHSAGLGRSPWRSPRVLRQSCEMRARTPAALGPRLPLLQALQTPRSSPPMPMPMPMHEVRVQSLMAMGCCLATASEREVEDLSRSASRDNLHFMLETLRPREVKARQDPEVGWRPRSPHIVVSHTFPEEPPALRGGAGEGGLRDLA